MAMRGVGLLLAGWALVGGCSAAGTDAAAPAHAAAPAKIDTGTLASASYRIDVPDSWNRALVVWFHGYATSPVSLAAGEPLAPQLQQLIDRGHAVAQSA